jgi:predicted ATPase
LHNGLPGLALRLLYEHSRRAFTLGCKRFRDAERLGIGSIMHVAHIAIRNLRALEDIDCDLSPRINVIVGPNAVGKTTILQALRLTKALLAPRINTEVQNVLVSLGAASPHFPQRVFLENLFRDPNKRVEVRCTYVLTDNDIGTLLESLPELVQAVVAARLGQQFANPATLIAFMQSPRGQQALSETQAELIAVFDKLRVEKSLLLGLTLDRASQQIIADDPMSGNLIAFLDQKLPPATTIFSYFPADRALPMGEVNLQLGGPEAQQQLESHNSQPQFKYQRLKNLIVGSLVSGEDTENTIHHDFEAIFTGLLKGRRIKNIGVNHLGLLSVMTEEVATKRLIELDSLSSGEKNIALTFLIIARSVAQGGIALFDEPELHLNPAVSRDLLSFIMNRYSKPRDIQFVMCTHSPEILSGAFADEECTLLHLKSATDITRVGKRAIDEYSDALSRLGTSVSDGLLFEGTILVEGVDDVIFLETGFPEISKKYKITDRGGRREVEKTVEHLQELEKRGEKVSPIFLIFDRDDQPSNLVSKGAIKVLQWKRRCAENYLLDTEVIASLLKDPEVSKRPLSSEGEVRRLMQTLALKQLTLIAAREVYASYGYQNASLRTEDFRGYTFAELSNSFYERAATARASIPDENRDTWMSAFVTRAEDRKSRLLSAWEAKWTDLCDGKQLISDLHGAAELRMSVAAFKARIVREMRDAASENWRSVRDTLTDFLSSPVA